MVVADAADGEEVQDDVEVQGNQETFEVPSQEVLCNTFD